MFIETIVVAVIIGTLVGGRLLNLKNISLRHIELFLLAFLVQTGLDFLAGQGTRWVIAYKGYFHVFSYVLLFAGLYINRKTPGIKTIGLGVLLNFLVVVLNQGQMPVEAAYLPPEVMEELRSGLNGTHSLITEGTRLKWLADTLYLPLPYANQMISVGDIVIDIGVLFMIISVMKDRGSYLKFTYINRQL